MTRLLVIGCGGFLGAIARYSATLWIQNRMQTNVPYGTMAVNVLGCVLLGFLAGWLHSRPEMSDEWQLFLKVGLLGAFTTFSTLGYETVTLYTDGEWAAAGVSLLGNLLLGGLGIVIGTAAARAVLS